MRDDYRLSLVPGFPEVVGEYLQLASTPSVGTPPAFAKATFLRLRLAADRQRPLPANAVIIAVPDAGGAPTQWLTLGAQLIAKAGSRACFRDDKESMCRVEVWIVNPRGAALADTEGGRRARAKRDPLLAVDYYFGRAILQADLSRPGKWPLGPPRELLAKSASQWRPLHQADAPFLADWGFATQAADIERMGALVRQRVGEKNVFLAGVGQGADFVVAYAAQRQGSGLRGYQSLGGLIFLGDAPTAGSLQAPTPTHIAEYADHVRKLRSGHLPVFLDAAAAADFQRGPAAAAERMTIGAHYALRSPDAESIFAPLAVRQQRAALVSGFAADASLSYRALASAADEIDLAPRRSLQAALTPQLDADPVSTTLARLYAESYAPARSNIVPASYRFAVSGEKIIDASAMPSGAWYTPARYEYDMRFLKRFKTVRIPEHQLDMDKSALVGIPVYVASQNAAGEHNPFPLIVDYVEINRSGVHQSAASQARSPFDPASHTRGYRRGDFTLADDSRAGQAAPGDPGASAIANTLLDWILARSASAAPVPTPGELGVRTVY